MRFIIAFLITLLLGYWLDSKFVNFIVSLFPVSMAEWMPLITVALWVIVGLYTFFLWFILSFMVGMFAQSIKN